MKWFELIGCLNVYFLSCLWLHFTKPSLDNHHFGYITKWRGGRKNNCINTQSHTAILLVQLEACLMIQAQHAGNYKQFQAHHSGN